LPGRHFEQAAKVEIDGVWTAAEEAFSCRATN
jgi:hypothetical protein